MPKALASSFAILATWKLSPKGVQFTREGDEDTAPVGGCSAEGALTPQGDYTMQALSFSVEKKPLQEETIPCRRYHSVLSEDSFRNCHACSSVWPREPMSLQSEASYPFYSLPPQPGTFGATLSIYRGIQASIQKKQFIINHKKFLKKISLV